MVTPGARRHSARGWRRREERPLRTPRSAVGRGDTLQLADGKPCNWPNRRVTIGRHGLTFDEDVVCAAAESDPVGFVADLPARTILDEVQRVPGLFTALKSAQPPKYR